MLAGQGYKQILEMIMKRLQPAFIRGSEYMVRGNSGFDLPTTEEPQSGNPYDPKSISAFEDYDYHLEYNTDDELVSFTSHDGTIRYVLNKDSFEELVTISVSIPKIDFKIALIYEFYDIRKNDPETDEKGKLIDVVIMTDDGKPFPLGLSINPTKLIANIGDTVEFNAIITNADGTTYDCTNNSSWSTDNSNYSIFNGEIVNVQKGKNQISAMYEMVIAYAELEVVDFTIVIDPGSVLVEYEGIEETIPYRAFKVDAKGLKSDITLECTWSINKWIGQLNNGVYLVNVSSTGNGTVNAIFKGKTATATIKSEAPEIVISPQTQTINVGSSASYKAIIASTGEDVTLRCSWITNNYSIGSDGIVVGVNSIGTATITANYNGSIATAQLIAQLPIPLQFPDGQSGTGKFYSKDYICHIGGTLTVEYDMYSYPDKLDIYSVNSDGSTGQLIATTGSLVTDQGIVTANVQHGQKVRIIISSDYDGTAWEYYANL